MAVLREAFELVRLAGSSRRRPGRFGSAGITGMDHWELAQTIRRLPDRYYGRIPERTLSKVTGAAAAGQWEKAVEELISSLSARAVPVTVDERQELQAVLEAMYMPSHRADALTLRH